jgi:hypothetical protein
MHAITFSVHDYYALIVGGALLHVISWMRSRRAGDGETELRPALTPRHA